MQDLFVYIIGALSVISGIGVVLSRKSLNSALCLIATMSFIAGHFAMMRADLMATLQILVYAGAIMILVVFVIMLLGVERDAERISFGLPAGVGISFALVFLGFVGLVLSQSSLSPLLVAQLESSIPSRVIEQDEVSISGVSKSLNNVTNPSEAAAIGALLVKDHIVAFQVIGVMLLAAIIAAAMLGFSETKPLLPGRGLQAVRKKFNVDVDD
ncbi:MAG TPA: NADH-quinone oxidoreductase subunit J [Oligoflexia bacterium]|nr:NADH-quinone oxidoreductase subunit J [Oligoflexia bacterium]HMP47892.1 NADH-quinone oxidoreductase subunit J [Oligoflexia bacterium]